MDEQQLQLQIMQLVLAAMQGDLQANAQIQKIMLAAQQGDQQAMQIAQMILQVAQSMQGSASQAEAAQPTAYAKYGAKLDYIRKLRGDCPVGYEMSYYKKGGRLCKKCMKKALGGEVKTNAVSNDSPVSQFKKTQAAKCGKKMKKAENGLTLMEKCGGKSNFKKKV